MNGQVKIRHEPGGGGDGGDPESGEPEGGAG